MRIRWISLLLSLLLFGWWGSTPVQAATDTQQSQYEVKLTPSASTTESGGDGDYVTGNSNNPTSSTGHKPSITAQGAQGATASRPTTGRLPQLSEGQWYGVASLIGVIMLLLFWVVKLSRRNRRSETDK